MAYYKTTGDYCAPISKDIQNQKILVEREELIKNSGYRYLPITMIDGLDYYYDQKNDIVYTIGKNDKVFGHPISFDVDKFVRYSTNLPELSEHKYYYGKNNIFK
jgi:hypothetical protein